MKYNFKDLFNVIKNQLLILSLVLLFKVLVYFSILPAESYYIQLINEFFSKYGLLAVFGSSFLENIIGFGSYFPGSVVILTSMALTNGKIHLAFLTFLCIVIPSLISHIINFYIGRKVSNYEKNKIPNLRIYLFTTLWHPHFAAITAFTLGSMKLSFKKFFFLFFPIHLFWNLFWGITMYYAGSISQENLPFLTLFYFYLLIWSIWDIYKFIRQKKRTNAQH